MKSDSEDARNAATLATSEGCAMRPKGVATEDSRTCCARNSDAETARRRQRFGNAVHAFGIDKSWTNGIHGNAMRSEFVGECLRKPDHGEFRGAIRRESGGAHLTRGRGHVDDSPAPLRFNHGARRCLTAQERPLPIDALDIVPDLLIQFHHRHAIPARSRSRVVNEYVESPETLDHLPNHPLDLPSISNIRDDHPPAPSDALDFAHNIRQPVPARGTIRVWAFNMIVDDHVCSLTREPYRDGAADAVLAPAPVTNATLPLSASIPPSFHFQRLFTGPS